MKRIAVFILIIACTSLGANAQAEVDTLLSFQKAKALLSAKEDTVRTTKFFIQNWQNAGIHRRIIADTVVSITSANQVINISRFGFTNVSSMNVQCTLFNNTTSALAGLIHNIKTYTTTSLSVNVFSVAAGLGTIFPTTTTGILLHIRIDGW